MKDNVPDYQTQPKEHFRGWFIPVEIVTAFNDGWITPSEVILLAIVNGYVRFGRSSHKNKGCFASNEHLSKLLKVSERQVRTMISRLKSGGFLVQTGYDGRRRYLETCWSSVGLDWKKTSGLRGRKLPVRSIIDKNNESDKSDSRVRSGGSHRRSGGFHLLSGESRFDIKMAEELRKAVKSSTKLNNFHKNKLNIRSNPFRLWANQLSKFRKKNKIPKSEVKEVFSWYIKNIEGQFTPIAYNASMFCSRFARIKQAMNRNFSPESTQKKKLSKKAVKIADDLCQFHNWPKGSEAQLPFVCDQSLKNYNRFYDALEKISHKSSVLKNIFLWLSNSGQSPELFVYDWMVRINEVVTDWEQWSGELKPFIFSYDQKRFVKMCRQETDRFCGDGSEWNEALLQLRKAMK